jgi:hypothetical protein
MSTNAPRTSLLDYEDYLIAEHLNGKSYIVTIESIKDEMVWDQEERDRIQKPVAYFKGTPRGLILSKVNRRTLIAMFGTGSFESFVGKRVILKAVEVKAFGKTETPIRIFPAPALPDTTARPAQQDKLEEQPTHNDDEELPQVEE